LNGIHRRAGRVLVPVMLAISLLAVACSDTATKSATTTAKAATRCSVPDASQSVTATAVVGSTSDHDLTSFDGTRIRFHWFPLADATPSTPKATVLMGPGWGQPGDSNPNAASVQGFVTIATLNKAGFNVLTWDPRGFGKSTGAAEVDYKKFEGRDVQRLLTWLSHQPGVQLDGAGDPRAGMVGGSYGGGIQLVTAGIDCRIDAIVPVIAWHSLVTSLGKAQTFKQGWSTILTNVSPTADLDPMITRSYQHGIQTGTVSLASQAWYAERGPGDELVGRIRVPTLIIQGTVDTLFPLEQGVTNFRILRKSGVPSAMLWFCGGHGACFTNPGDPDRVERAAIAWLQRYVQRDESVQLGPRFDMIDQNGVRYTADDVPTPSSSVTGTGSGTLALTAQGGSGPATTKPAPTDVVGGLAADIMPGKATNAVNVSIPAGSTAQLLVGAPTVTLHYSGTVADGDRPERIFAQLVDDTTGIVVGNQVTPIPVVLDGKQHTTTVPLEWISFNLIPGSSMTLQLVATTVAYAQPRLGGSVQFGQVKVALPVVTGMHKG
jgi:ABC-2 type transport system ATP-binding protein